jgi:hypothetical protein
MRVCVCLCMYACTSVCMHVCMLVAVHICMHVRMSVCICKPRQGESAWIRYDRSRGGSIYVLLLLSPPVSLSFPLPAHSSLKLCLLVALL